MFKEINFLLKGREERQLAKKKTIVFSGSISIFFVKDSFKNNDVAQNEFLKDLGLFVQNYQFILWRTFGANI